MSSSAKSISFSYDQSLEALDVTVSAVSWRDYELTKQMTEAGWTHYFQRLLTDQAWLIGMASALTVWLSRLVIPDFRMPRLWSLIALGTLVGLVSLSISHYLWRTSRQRYLRAFMQWSLARELDRAKTLTVKIAAEGIEVRSATDIVVLTWHRFMIGYQDGNYLVLVFEGSTYAIPVSVLPEPVDDLIARIRVWSEEYLHGYSGSELSSKLKRFGRGNTHKG